MKKRSPTLHDEMQLLQARQSLKASKDNLRAGRVGPALRQVERAITELKYLRNIRGWSDDR